MRTSGEFHTTEHAIKLSRYGDKAHLALIGDIHWEAEHHCAKKFGECIKATAALENHAALGMGDLFDFGSTSERGALQKAALHNDTYRTIGLMLKEKCEKFAEQVSGINWIGHLGGNHDMPFLLDGRQVTMTQHVCELLGVPFLGVCAFVRLKLSIQTSATKCDIFAHHGMGGGSTKGASVNRVVKMQDVIQADVYAMGDNHDLGCWTGTSLRVDPDLRVREYPVLFCRTGSFLKAYEPGSANYNVDACRAPCSLGWVVTELEPKRERGEGGRGLYVEKRGIVC